VGHTLYTYTISDYGHPESLALATPKSLGPAVFFSGVITASGAYIFISPGDTLDSLKHPSTRVLLIPNLRTF
jgi:hypothetical protein